MASLRAKKHVQLTLDQARRPTGHGGWRPGAGRPKGRTKVAHEEREAFAARYPQLVTWRVLPGVPSLRRHTGLEIVKDAIRRGGRCAEFRVVHFNLLSNHLHLIVEAASVEALARGMQSLAGRIVRRINRWLGRSGGLFAERYHARTLRSPTEVRAALRYVLLNMKHHRAESGERPGHGGPDPYSSAVWFDGWLEPFVPREPWQRELAREEAPTAEATGWLLTTGWRLAGPLSYREVPGKHTRPRRRTS